jgi:hypothetical protein
VRELRLESTRLRHRETERGILRRIVIFGLVRSHWLEHHDRKIVDIEKPAAGMSFILRLVPITNRQKCFWRRMQILKDNDMIAGPYVCALESGNISVCEQSHIILVPDAPYAG